MPDMFDFNNTLSYQLDLRNQLTSAIIFSLYPSAYSANSFAKRKLDELAPLIISEIEIPISEINTYLRFYVTC